MCGFAARGRASVAAAQARPNSRSPSYANPPPHAISLQTNTAMLHSTATPLLRRAYATSSFMPSSASSPASPFAVFDRAAKLNQRQRAASNKERSRLTDYVKHDVAANMVDRLLVSGASLPSGAADERTTRLSIAIRPRLVSPRPSSRIPATRGHCPPHSPQINQLMPMSSLVAGHQTSFPFGTRCRVRARLHRKTSRPRNHSEAHHDRLVR